MTTPQFPGEKALATPLEQHRMRMESRREAQERERHEAEAADRLWTIYGALKLTENRERTAFILAFRGRHDSEADQDGFTSQHVGAIIMGPTFIIGDGAEVAAQIAKMLTVDTMTIRWVV